MICNIFHFHKERVLNTGAQEWHIVSLLGDVTSPTTVAHYVTMTSDYMF